MTSYVINKETKEVIGVPCQSLEEVKDEVKKHLFRPYIDTYGFILYQEPNGEYGVCTPRKFTITEEVKKQKSVFEYEIMELA